jgi:hypothetical protein
MEFINPYVIVKSTGKMGIIVCDYPRKGFERVLVKLLNGDIEYFFLSELK